MFTPDAHLLNTAVTATHPPFPLILFIFSICLLDVENGTQALAHEGRARLPHRQRQRCQGGSSFSYLEKRLAEFHSPQFSVDDFEAAGTTPWEGVRNAEARNIMKSMHVGDKVLFYHSNCKNPGIAAFAEASFTRERSPKLKSYF